MKKTLILLLLSSALLQSCARKNRMCQTYGHGWSVGKHKAPHD